MASNAQILVFDTYECLGLTDCLRYSAVSELYRYEANTWKIKMCDIRTIMTMWSFYIMLVMRAQTNMREEWNKIWREIKACLVFLINAP